MGPISFARNDYPTLGVELELQMVDAKTFAPLKFHHGIIS